MGIICEDRCFMSANFGRDLRKSNYDVRLELVERIGG
jgi:hypothetical protein